MNPDTGDVTAKGLCERIGLDGRLTHKVPATGKKVEKDIPMPTHKEAIEAVMAILVDPVDGVIKSVDEIDAVGHRIVHGGEAFSEAALITEEMIKEVEACNDLAPLHNPANLIGVRACQEVLGKDALTAIIDTYCSTLEKSGYYVGIYSTYLYLRDNTHIDKLDKYDKWIAQWSTNCTSKKPFGMWQFGGETNKIRINKVAGMTCDQNYCYKDYPTIMQTNGLNGFGKTANTESIAKKTVDELAREVIDGKWGTGANRKRRLMQAGYDYTAVQKRVNQLM